VGRAARGDGPDAAVGGRELSDILAGHGGDEAVLAELYDLEHDEISEDLVFYREQAQRAGGRVVDLGCGSGRLFASLLVDPDGRLVGVDGSRALLARAEARISADARLRRARDDGRLELAAGDVRTVRRPDRFALAVLAGVLAHLDGPEDALRALDAARSLVEPDGRVIVDTLGPGGLPPRDLPLSVDWERETPGGRVVRRSQLVRREVPEGLRVEYSTLTDLLGPDGTIARLPAGFRLWYPSVRALVGLVEEARMSVEDAFGSHDLDPIGDQSERCILVVHPSKRSGME
jgi:SAM-dependent methyltransferase